MYLGKSCCIRPKVVVFEGSGRILAKVVIFGQRRLNSDKGGCIRAKWLYSVKSGCFGEKWLNSGIVVVLGKRWLY